MSKLIVTIGVYGFTEEQFFAALNANRVTVLCDIRMRRGVRGRAYAFANSTRLQERCHHFGIKYVYLKDLAPTLEMRKLQWAADKSQRINKSQRRLLSEDFVERYRAERLAESDVLRFVDDVIGSGGIPALMCVEMQPQACHRAIVADYIAAYCGYVVKHLIP
jgi:uncharacterized protein (DUF488 family)